jgi:antitoxin (DNA-binding transcriptional repressor) of toxin-antitoxin stability system
VRHTISATALARQLGDVLGRVRYRGDCFIVERSGVPVARIEPTAPLSEGNIGEALRAWRDAAEPDPDFADDLERVGAHDMPPRDPWVS